MYNTTIVLDACTIINLLRIDTEDGFLLDLLLTKYTTLESLCITEEVWKETKRNIFANVISEEKEAQINKELPRFQLYLKKNSDITNLTEIEEFVREYANYKKRFNGELCSSIFCVKQNMEEHKLISFITDDYPAKEQFSDLFSFLHIGIMEDTIDLLISAYQSQPRDVFTKFMLLEYLSRLRSRYAQDAINLVEAAQRVKDGFNTVQLQRKNRKTILALDSIIDGWYNKDWTLFCKGMNSYKEVHGNDKVLYPLIKRDNIFPINKHLEKIEKRLIDIERYGDSIFLG